MAEKLKKHLLEKSSQSSQIKLLQSQWNFDEELIPKALQNISHIFTSYSRHDESHSRKILVNIERILGERINHLTATDTWLLLEAAYWHDIGMVVSHDDIEKEIQSDAFRQFVRIIGDDKGHELHEFAKKFAEAGFSTCFVGASTPQKACDLFRRLLAEWFRRSHPERSREAVLEPWEKLSVNSPRTELVPYRLFRFLGQICMLHGSDFNVILETLPLRETGMDTEDCHPRFVACLLRLGDLFDLDDNRFCPVMLKMAGELPESSQAHLDKHLAIRHIRLDPERVELSAECESYECYETADRWFRWIEDEFRNQMAHWNDIAPDRLFGLLPTLGNLEVHLRGYEILDPGQRPSFTVDPQKTIEMLQGAGLYSSKWQCIRELLQNAVDAVLMRIWITHGSDQADPKKKISFENPLSEEVKKIFQQYPIQVKIKKVSENDDGDRVVYSMEIEDAGIGISKEDISFMRTVGSSKKNLTREKIIEEMPDWMRPSGAFGIGLQSAFMVTGEIIYDSRSIFSGEALKMTMKSPLGKHRGQIYVQRMEGNLGADFGTKTIIEIEIDKIAKEIEMPQDKNDFSQEIINKFDPIRMKEFNYEIGQLADHISWYSELSLIPVEIMANVKNMKFRKKSGGLLSGENFVKQKGIVIHQLKFKVRDRWEFVLYYRGQLVQKHLFYFPFVYARVNLLSGKAGNLLTINRNEIKDDAREELYSIVREALLEYIGGLNFLDLPKKDREAASAVFKFEQNRQKSVHRSQNSSTCEITEFPSKLIGEWRSLTIDLMEDGRTSIQTIDSLCKKVMFKIYIREAYPLEKDWIPQDGYVLERSDFLTPTFNLFLDAWVEEEGRYRFDDDDEWEGMIIFFSKENKDLPPISDVLFKRHLGGFYTVGGRVHMPGWGEYNKLVANVDEMAWCRPLLNLDKMRKEFILPFYYNREREKITTEGFDELCEWTYNNSLIDDNEKPSKEDKLSQQK